MRRIDASALARKTSVSVTPSVDALIRKRGENFSDALRQMAVTYEYLTTKGRRQLGNRRLEYYRWPPRQAQLRTAWLDMTPDPARLRDQLLLCVPQDNLRLRLSRLEPLELIALYDTILQEGTT